MNNKPPLVHPDLLRSLVGVGYFPSLCTIQEIVETQDAAGQAIETFVGLPGREAIPCRVAPSLSGDSEIRQDALTVEIATHDVFLWGYYPDIRPKQRVWVDERLSYDILIPRYDSAQATTVLKTKLVTT